MNDPLTDPLGIRSQFPVADEVLYLNSPFMTPSPQTAVTAAQNFAAAKGRIPYDLDEMLAKCDELRGQYAALINAKEGEVGLLYTTSEAENMVVDALNLQPGDNIVTDDLHYSGSMVIFDQLAQRGIDVRVAQSVDGCAPPEIFAPLLDDNTRLISVAWISHQNGYRHDLAGLADLAHAQGAYLYADVIQGVGALPLDVQTADLDFCSAGSYKWLLGGFGVALFFVREALLPLIPPHGYGFFHIAEQSDVMTHKIYEDGRKFMYATPNFGSIYQLSAGIELLQQVGVEKIAAHVVALTQKLRDGLAEMGYTVWTPADNESTVVAFEHGLPLEMVQQRLKSENVYVTFRGNGRYIRVGPALFNNQNDIDQFLSIMWNCKSLRN